MNLPAALAHLAAAGITADVLAAEHVDPADPEALLGLVDAEIRAITDGDCLADYRHVGALYLAREALLPDSERAKRDAIAARLRADLEAMYDVPACSRAA
jgi:hypothetical protein